MRPDSRTILDSIIASLETYVLPKVDDDFARSILKTTQNLLRHVQIRIVEEPILLHADFVDLAGTLSDIRVLLRDAPDLSDALALDPTFQAPSSPNDVVIALDILQERWDTLNDHLDQVLQRLSRLRGAFEDDRTYRDIRDAICAYLGRHLEREDRLISPAFTGGRR